MAAGDPGEGEIRLPRRNPSLGLGGLNSEPRTARTTVKFIDLPTFCRLTVSRPGAPPVTQLEL